MRLSILILLCVIPSAAQASFVDVFDLGPAMARAGAVSTTTQSGDAAYYNPAGLAGQRQIELRVGCDLLRSQLTIRRQRVPIARPFAGFVEVAAPLPLGGILRDRLTLGMALHASPTAWLDVTAPTSTTPLLPYYHNRTQRLVALFGLGLHLSDEVALGVGINYFAGVTGTVRATDGAARDLQANVDEEFYGMATLHAGGRMVVGDYTVALVYRSQFSVPVQTVSSALLNDTPLALDIEANALFTPQTLVVGISRRGDGWRAGLDISLRRWSGYTPAFARVHALVPVPLSQTGETFEVDSTWHAPKTHDVVRAAAFIEWQPTPSWTLASGYAFEPSAFEAQPGPTNLIDGAKHILGGGISYTLPTIGRMHWDAEAALQAQWMTPRRLTKDPALLPDEYPDTPGRQTTNLGYPTIAGGGWVFAGMLSVVVTLAKPSDRERRVAGDEP